MLDVCLMVNPVQQNDWIAFTGMLGFLQQVHVNMEFLEFWCIAWQYMGGAKRWTG